MMGAVATAATADRRPAQSAPRGSSTRHDLSRARCSHTRQATAVRRPAQRRRLLGRESRESPHTRRGERSGCRGGSTPPAPAEGNLGWRRRRALSCCRWGGQGRPPPHTHRATTHFNENHPGSPGTEQREKNKRRFHFFARSLVTLTGINAPLKCPTPQTPKTAHSALRAAAVRRVNHRRTQRRHGRLHVAREQQQQPTPKPGGGIEHSEGTSPGHIPKLGGGTWRTNRHEEANSKSPVSGPNETQSPSTHRRPEKTQIKEGDRSHDHILYRQAH